MSQLPCFYCGHALRGDFTQFQAGIWITECSTCGVVNTLTQANPEASTLVVSGGFFNMQKRT